MIKAVKDFFNQHLNFAEQRGGTDAAERQDPHVLRLATASLMIEVMRADFNVTDQERRRVVAILQQYQGLTEKETDELLVLAEQEVAESVSLFQFTKLVDSQYSYEQKRQIVEMLWEVVYADAHKDKHEEYIVRKITDLLHVSHKDFIEARHKAEQQIASGGSGAR